MQVEIWEYMKRTDPRRNRPKCVLDLRERPIWPWLDRKTPPDPPKLGLDKLDLIVDVWNWAHDH